MFREIGPKGNKNLLYLISSIAFLVLIIACINFTILSTARATGRAKEIGVRKVLGAKKDQLVKQFLFESIILASIGMVISIFLVIYALPIVNQLTNKTLDFSVFYNVYFVSEVVAITIIAALVGGFYPAFFLSAFKPINVLKGMLNNNFSNQFAAKSLIVVQFSISIGLIICSSVMFQQGKFIDEKDPGFNKDGIIGIQIRGRSLQNNIENIKAQFLENPNILKVAASTGIPGSGDWGAPLYSVGTEDQYRIGPRIMLVDHDYFDLFGMEIASGRNFSKEIDSDKNSSFVFNEAAEKSFINQGMEGVNGKDFEIRGWVKGKNIGVVKDFHFRSMEETIQPMIFFRNESQSRLSLILIKVEESNYSEVIEFLRDKWPTIDSINPLSYFFVDESYHDLNNGQRSLLNIFMYLTIIAVIIACMGIYGLSNFSTSRRLKELGIRKILGADSKGMVFLLLKDYFVLVSISLVIAIPSLIYLMNSWLQNFAYRVDLGINVFVISGVLSISIVLVTVSFQTLKAVFANPVDTLRND